MEVLYILAKTVEIILYLLSSCMFLRVIMQFFPNTENIFFIMAATVAETYVLPFRMLCNRFGLFQNTPFDAPFMMAYLFLSAVQITLPIL